VVKLCFFVGLGLEQAARVLDVSVSAADRLLGYAWACLFRALRKLNSILTGIAIPDSVTGGDHELNA
jgi:hypothetical protein